MATDTSQLEGLRILVAEDEGLIALELETVLQGFGCEVVGPVSRVAEVLRRAGHGDLDGALLDVNLRGEQIFPTAHRLCSRRTGHAGAATDESFPPRA